MYKRQVYNADLYSEDDREIEVMEPVRVLNLFTIMNRGGDVYKRQDLSHYVSVREITLMY